MKFYATFGQSHTHPDTGEKMKDYWMEAFGRDRREALLAMYAKFADQWSHLYLETEFVKDYYPKGKYGEVGEMTPEDEADEIIEKIYEQRRNNREAERARDNEHKLSSEDKFCEG